MKKDNKNGQLKDYYTIGEVSKICNISTKALRHYEQIGLLFPDLVSKETGYRYYSHNTLLLVPIVKYYKQMGFKLEEMQHLVDGKSYYYMENAFHEKMKELRKKEREISNSLVSLGDWHDMLDEARVARMNNIQHVFTKYWHGCTYCYMEQDFDYRYAKSIINIDWTNHLEKTGCQITGPVMLNFSSFEDKMEGCCTRVKIMQKPVSGTEGTIALQQLSSQMTIAKYHMGSLENIAESYRMIKEWALEHNLKIGSESFERYLVDMWTTKNSDEFVTEIIVPIVP